MKWLGGWRRWVAVLSRWLLLWWLMVTLGFVWLSFASHFASQGQRATHGLDATRLSQYPHFFGRIVRGDLGSSIHSGHSITEMVVAGLPVDLMLGGGALLAAWVIGSVWGSLGAVRADRVLAASLMWLARGFVSLSVVVLVPLSVLFVSATDRWSMRFGGGPLWLPMLALAMPYAAWVARQTQRRALVALRSETVLTARANGLPRSRIWMRQVLPAARLPLAKYCGLPLVSMLTSVVVIEHLLGVAGTGRFFIAAAEQQDHAVIVGLGIVYGSLLIIVKLGVDLLRHGGEPA